MQIDVIYIQEIIFIWMHICIQNFCVVASICHRAAEAQRELHGFEVTDLRELCQERRVRSAGFVGPRGCGRDWLQLGLS